MAIKPVKVRLRGTHMAVWRLDRQVNRAVRLALLESAQNGKKVIQRKVKRKPYPNAVAHGEYLRSWGVKKTPKGAVLGSSVPHSIHVEVGRDPGAPPPIDKIRDWVLAKKIVKPVRAPRKRKRKKRRDLSKRTDKQRARSAQRRYKSFLKRSKAQKSKARSMAVRIAKSIGKYGVSPRYPLYYSLPRMGRYLRSQMRKNIKLVTKRHKG